SRETNNLEGLIVRARSEAMLGESQAAVADFSEAIARSRSPGPDLFLDRARLQADLGEFEQAARGLDQVISNSPFASPLHLKAIEYDRHRGAYDCALKRVDAIAARYPVKEPWLTLRAEVLEQAGRLREAEGTFRQVLDGIAAYPEVRRSLDLTKQLERRARDG